MAAAGAMRWASAPRGAAARAAVDCSAIPCQPIDAKSRWSGVWAPERCRGLPSPNVVDPRRRSQASVRTPELSLR